MKPIKPKYTDTVKVEFNLSKKRERDNTTVL